MPLCWDTCLDIFEMASVQSIKAQCRKVRGFEISGRLVVFVHGWGDEELLEEINWRGVVGFVHAGYGRPAHVKG